jgi:SAM-dependent methyltransferase
MQSRLRKITPWKWWRYPDDPTKREGGYNSYPVPHDTEPPPSILRELLWKVYPEASKRIIDPRFWRDTYAPLSLKDELFWRDHTGINDSDELEQRFREVQGATWQIVQELCFARFWFLKNIMAANPHYHELQHAARQGATIVDLGCGLGQDLRRLRADGATGELIGVDNHPKLWELGSSLFKNEDPEKSFSFVELDIMSKQPGLEHLPQNALGQFTDKADIYLLNDVLTFLGGKYIGAILSSIKRASRVGTKMYGWVVGQVGEPPVGSGKEHGGGNRGAVFTLKTFCKILANPGYGDRTIKWDVKAQLIGFDQLGLDQEDQDWFGVTLYWDKRCPEDLPDELKAICFFAERVE